MNASVNPADLAPSEFPLTPRSMPRVLLSLIRNPLDALPPQIFEEPFVFTRMAGKLRVYLADPELIYQTLVRNSDALGKGEDVRRLLGPALGDGILTSDGAHWKWQRQSVAGAFRHEKLVELQPAMIAAAERRRNLWLTHKGSSLDLCQEMMRTTFDIIVETMMSGGDGIDVDKVERNISNYLKPTGWKFALGLVGAPDWMPYPGKEKAKTAVVFLRATLAKVIAERRTSSIERHDLVSMLLEAADPETGRMMTDEEIIDNLMTFITAGHETTALGLAWTLHLLARHPDCQARLFDEIAKVTDGGPLLAEHVGKLTYARQVFSESMRLYPPAPVISRMAVREFTLGGYRIPPGTILYVPIYAVHRHAALWEDPLVFDPDRFEPETVRYRHRFAFMPFGAGPRVCIGNGFAMMEAVAILAVLLQKFRVIGSGDPSPKPVMKVTLRPMHPLPISLIER
ncbi:cytochrome P450 hydroxylase [Rhizobium freirei PRF 81]|uniref:Cytochrome P450 hydroxylase n=1 Tax=Rhizobium freirei PRF 81 TaxID=363754 RepID=N6V2W8_9HYPH|nr:cytochrome P450 [Rhizobium freirei]ENN88220.1 cytochrome P450 hydroxylase [Rhizobium freirei PRF 81]